MENIRAYIPVHVCINKCVFKKNNNKPLELWIALLWYREQTHVHIPVMSRGVERGITLINRKTVRDLQLI